MQTAISNVPCKYAIINLQELGCVFVKRDHLVNALHRTTSLVLARPPEKLSTALSFLKTFTFLPLNPFLKLTTFFFFNLHSRITFISRVVSTTLGPLRAENDMAVPPPDSSYTPPHTPLIEESPFISDSMDDLDPQATRKRPRLDSGSRVSPTLSLDGTSRTASVAPASDMDEASDSGNPVNKVTINTKSPLSPMAPDLPPSDAGLSGSDLELLPDTDTAPNPNPISLSSSPSSSRSPQIEVAEPEDINQDPNTSNWKSLGQVVRDQDEPEVIEIQDVAPLSDSFPKVHTEMTPRENFKALGDMLEFGNKRLQSTRPGQNTNTANRTPTRRHGACYNKTMASHLCARS